LSSFFSAGPSAAIGLGDGCVAPAGAGAGGASFFCDSCFCCSCETGRGSCSAFSGFFGSAFFPLGRDGDGRRRLRAQRRQHHQDGKKDDRDSLHGGRGYTTGR
jgi:hypothetical protein